MAAKTVTPLTEVEAQVFSAVAVNIEKQVKNPLRERVRSG
jgi:hypothetical protein